VPIIVTANAYAIAAIARVRAVIEDDPAIAPF
jgi:hypothetical protein